MNLDVQLSCSAKPLSFRGGEVKRLALVLALTGSACASDGRGSMGGPPLRPTANPSAVVAAELGFSQLAQDKGQWTAFRATAAPGAEMFVPERAKAADWLKGRADPSVPVKWQAYEVWSSCDGSHAVTRGRWERPGSAGTFVTVWQRQKDGKQKWLLDMSLADDRPSAPPEMVAARVADCGKSPQQIAALAAADAALLASGAAAAAGGERETVLGGAADTTLTWESSALAGVRRFKVRLWNGAGFETVVEATSRGIR